MNTSGALGRILDNWGLTARRIAFTFAAAISFAHLSTAAELPVVVRGPGFLQAQASSYTFGNIVRQSTAQNGTIAWIAYTQDKWCQLIYVANGGSPQIAVSDPDSHEALNGYLCNNVASKIDPNASFLLAPQLSAGNKSLYFTGITTGKVKFGNQIVNGTVTASWRLRDYRVVERVVTVGDTVTVSFPTGDVLATVDGASVVVPSPQNAHELIQLGVTTLDGKGYRGWFEITGLGTFRSIQPDPRSIVAPFGTAILDATGMGAFDGEDSLYFWVFSPGALNHADLKSGKVTATILLTSQIIAGEEIQTFTSGVFSGGSALYLTYGLSAALAPPTLGRATRIALWNNGAWGPVIYHEGTAMPEPWRAAQFVVPVFSGPLWALGVRLTEAAHLSDAIVIYDAASQQWFGLAGPGALGADGKPMQGISPAFSAGQCSLWFSTITGPQRDTPSQLLYRYLMPCLTSGSTNADTAAINGWNLQLPGTATTVLVDGAPVNATLSPASIQLRGLRAGPHKLQVRMTHPTGTVLSESLTLISPPTALEGPTVLKISDGDHQTAAVGGPLSRPLSAQVFGASGKALDGVVVTFEVASGKATLSAGTVVTGTDGSAQVTVTFGSSAGAVVVSATVFGLPSASFHLTANPLPAISANGVVSAASNQPLLAPGGLATVYGTNFTAEAEASSNLTGTKDGGSYWFVGLFPNKSTSHSIGFNFVVPSANDLVFTGGALLAFLVSGTNSINVSLFADDGGKPGAVLESFTLASVLTSASALIPFRSQLNPTLTAGRQYWLAAAMTEPLTSLAGWLSPPSDDPGLGAFRVPGGAWTPGPSNRPAFAIYGFPKAGFVPLPRSLGGVTVSLGGFAAPVLYASGTQINFQVPYETPAGATSVVVNNGAPSTPASVTVAPTAPGIFVYGSNWAVVQNQDYSVNGPSNPARAGSYVTLYGTGSGAVSPAVPTGNAAPNSPLSTVANVTATINGVPASVSFAGLTPASVGLLQVNLQIPDLPAGTYAIQIVVGNAKSNSASIGVMR